MTVFIFFPDFPIKWCSEHIVTNFHLCSKLRRHSYGGKTPKLKPKQKNPNQTITKHFHGPEMETLHCKLGLLHQPAGL